MHYFIQKTKSQVLSWLSCVDIKTRLRIASFLAGFFLVIGIGAVNLSLGQPMWQGFAIAAPYNVQKIFLDEQSQKSFLMSKIRYNPSYLTKVMGKDVQDLLSAPSLVRQDRPTIVWQYRSENCVLDVYFATMNEDPLFAPVVHYEMRGRNVRAKAPNEKACIREIAVQAENKPV